jgi:hypothetical protein
MATRSRQTKPTPSLVTLAGAAGIAAVAALPGAGCLSRDVAHSAPTTSTTFTATVRNQAIDKVDLLFVIDNSASMGDKQQYLQQAVPDLLTRLVTPSCLDPVTGESYGPSDSSGNCARGHVEFPPVHDMHVGVLSTSLGARLGDQCDPTRTVTLLTGTTLSNNNDDRGELLDRAGPTETPLADLGTSFYLNWFPATPANSGRQPGAGAPPITDPAKLQSDFTAMIQGVGTFGCGIESQLESWYRFLVQPDPYDSLALGPGRYAQWQGVDATLLKQRHDFLRPDSLVAIIDMTDEDDSEIDVRSVGGTGYQWMSTGYDPPRGTVGCAENAAGTGLVDPSSCTGCLYASNASADPSCAMGGYSSAFDWGYNPNLRHVHMTQKYGEWPQFPIERYSTGLSSTTVPDRRGEYPQGAFGYQGLNNRNCDNPLFAASLPDGSSTDADTLCKLPAGTRTPDLVYYAHIGGVPHQLLQQDPTNPDSPQKATLTTSDWVKILGNDPEHEDYSGADPHMIESYQPRPGLPAPTSPPPGGNPDPISGREWTTDQGDGHILEVDREYACIFELPAPRDCSNRNDPLIAYGCDCPDTASLTYAELPPLCDPATQTKQVAAKAYPTTRELLLAKQMGNRGIVSSLCPIHVTPANGDNPPDPVYGYRPAMNAIVDRLAMQLSAQCTPEKLDIDACGNVPCLLMATLPSGTEADCASTPGMSVPDPSSLAYFQQQQHIAWLNTGGGGTDPSTLPTCQLDQLSQLPAGASASSCPTPSPATDFDGNGSCKYSKDPGWCYVRGGADAGTGCQQAIVFSHGEPPPGVTVSLQCLEQSVSVLDAGAD